MANAPAALSPAPAMSGGPILKMTGVSKRFPGVLALENVHLEVGPSEIHALLGENGAGKSTLLKVLSGAQSADAGEIELFGKPVAFATPHDAQRAGIVTIYQEFTLAPDMTIAENVFIGREPGSRLFVSWRRLAEETKAIAERIGLKRDPMTQVRDLSVAEQQLVEIARALSMQSRLIIMDEPTAALSETEVANLVRIVRALKAEGLSIIFVTHRLDEVFRLCDRYTVLRDGHYVASGKVAETNVEAIIRMMVGRDVGALYGERPIPEHGKVALEVEGLTRRRNARDPNAIELVDVSLKAHHGEILGLAGLVGAGRTETARAIFGADPFDHGTIRVDGEEVRFSSPRDAMSHGIGLVPEDRKKQALFLSLAIRTNMTIAAQDEVSRGWFIDEKQGGRADRRVPQAPVDPHGEPGAGGGSALGRQSAEDRAGALAGAQAQDPHRRRADARHRHRLQGRGPQSPHRHGEAGHRGHRHFVGAAGNSGGLGPHRDDARGPRHRRDRAHQGDAGNPDGDDDGA